MRMLLYFVVTTTLLACQPTETLTNSNADTTTHASADGQGGQGPVICGDGICGLGETNLNCDSDCEALCGDGVCDLGEDTVVCPIDCLTWCGDGVCNGDEHYSVCAVDCDEDRTAPTDPQNPTSPEGNPPAADCSGCLNGAASCEAHCQIEGLSGGFCAAPGSMNPEVCCVCDDPAAPPPPTTSCGDGTCNGDENSDNCAADCPIDCGPAPHYQVVNGQCLPSCGALINDSGWSEGSCCQNGCADASQNGNISWDCSTCCPGLDSCLDSKPSPPPVTPSDYAESDCLVTPSNDNEVCDDEGFTVGSNTDLALVCMGNQGGKVYIASNTGPVMFDGIPRCQGWENNGQNAWDHLDYLAVIVCDGTQSVQEVDLSNWAGKKVYVGVHDHPNQGAGHNTMACIVNSKNVGWGEPVTPPPATGPAPDPAPDTPPTNGCELGGLYNDAIADSVYESAVYVKNNHPEFFDIEHWSDYDRRAQAYKMMTAVINHLRAKCVLASRCVANPGYPQSNPFHFCSDALVIGPPGQGTTVDIYQSWSAPAHPQTHVTEEGGQTGVVTADLVPLAVP